MSYLLTPTPSSSLPLSATIENFNVVEMLSDNAAIVYQTHKVRVTGEYNQSQLTVKGICCFYSCHDETVCVAAGVARISEGRAVPVCHEEDPGQQ